MIQIVILLQLNKDRPFDTVHSPVSYVSFNSYLSINEQTRMTQNKLDMYILTLFIFLYVYPCYRGLMKFSMLNS